MTTVITRRIPLLRDRHTHPLLYAALHEGVDLGAALRDLTGSNEELRGLALERIHAAARERDAGWVIAHGWNNGLYPLAREDFDDIALPCVVFNLSLHTLLVNEAGRTLLGRNAAHVIPHLDDQEWIERNLLTLLNLFAGAGASAERLQRWFRRLLEEQGVFHAEEMLLVNENEIRLFEEAGLSDRTRFWAAPGDYEQLPEEMKKKVQGIKLFTDGALGTWTAALNQPYRDQGGTGLLIYSDADLGSLLRRYAGTGMPMAVHAIGDRAIDQVVAALEPIRRPENSEVRIEHAQFIDEPTARRAKDLGVTLCMQPNFSEDSANYVDRLPDGYAERNNPFRMLIDRVGYVPGVDLIFGSDGMPHGWRAGLRESLFPEGGHAGQVLKMDEFVAGYCLPDLVVGYIDVTIDEGKRAVEGKVVTVE